jgi:Large polyvalent protein-associated domain 3
MSEIPTTTLWENYSKDELRELVRDFYKKNLQGKLVLNKDRHLIIQFTSDGLGKLYRGSTINPLKASAIKVLAEMIEIAEYSNFGGRKETDKQNVIGFLNFKSKAIIGNTLYHFRISIKFKTDGKAYYSHTINEKATM